MGRIIAKAAADSNLKKVSLELGGMYVCCGWVEFRLYIFSFMLVFHFRAFQNFISFLSYFLRVAFTLIISGKSPLIVMDDVNVAEAAKIAHEGCFENHGQCCW